MRTLSSAIVASFVAVPLGCGGGGAATHGAQPSDTLAPTTGSQSSTGVADAGPTTTTMALGDGGDLQGSRLTETHSVAATTSASAGAVPRSPHSHDPGRSPADIRAIVIAHREEARGCYDAALKDHPGIEGDLVIQWTIDPKGNVTQVSLDASRSTIAEPSVAACVGEIIKRIQFASSAGGFETKAFYPFNFHPRHGQPPPSGER